MKYFNLFMLLGLMSCSNVEEIGSLRIIGSNTEQNYFNETVDNQILFLKKNEMYFLNDNFVSNLNLNKFSADSMDIERVAGTSDSLLLLSKTGLKLYLTKTKKTIALKNYGFSICDKMALVDSFVVVSQGKSVCQPNIASKFLLFKINKSSELVALNQYVSGPIVDLQIRNKKIFFLDSSGNLAVFEINASNELNKLSEFPILGAEFMRVIPASNKVLVKTKNGLVQLKMGLNNKFEKINEL